MRLKNNPYLIYSCVGLGALLVFGCFQLTTNFSDPDSYYHARLISLMAQHGLLYQFPWLQSTNLVDQFTDHHLLYHLLLTPLLHWFDPIITLKIGQVILSSALVISLVWILRRWRLPYSGWATVLLLVTSAWLIRINLVKATPLAVLLFVVGIVLMVERNYWWAGTIALVYTWAHGGFLLALVAVIVLVVADTVAGSWQQRRLMFGDPRPIWITLVSLVVGVVINPYFPGNLQFYWQQVIQIGVVNYQNIIEVGAEWYPFSLSTLASMTSLLFIAGVGALILSVQHYKKSLGDVRAVSLFLLTLVLFAATLRSRRYIDYFVPVLWLWCCWFILPYIHSRAWQAQLIKLQRQFGQWFIVLVIYFAITLPFGAWRAVKVSYDTLRDGIPPTTYQAASDWLRTNTQPGEIVFHTDWDDFPMLFYHNTHNYYVVGLDATFMYLANPDQYQHWLDLSSGKIKTAVAQTIIQQFNAYYVFIDRADTDSQLLNAYLRRDPQAQLVFEDEATRVYHLED